MRIDKFSTICKISLIISILYIVFLHFFAFYTINNFKKNNADFQISVYNRFQEVNESLQNINGIIDRTEASILSTMDSAEKRIIVASMRESRSTRVELNKVETTYSSLLQEQQKRTVDSMYTGSELQKMRSDANTMASKGEYENARQLFTLLHEQDPSDNSFRMGLVYSTFMINRLDKSKYDFLLEHLEALRVNGFHDPAIQQISDFIAVERSIF